MNDNVQRHKTICDELNALYERKNADYGDSFHQSYLDEGIAMSRIRLGDKLNRFKKLTKDPESQRIGDESVRDTLIDLANYAIMTVLELDAMKRINKPNDAADDEVGSPVCTVSYRGDQFEILHNSQGYYIDSEKCVICDLCRYDDIYPSEYPCNACRNHTGTEDKFIPRN